MASQGRSTSDSLALYDRMADSIAEYGFFQALRLIHKANPSVPGLGRSSRPQDDPIRLGQTPHTIFAPSTLADFSLSEDQAVPQLSVYFFGLFGPNGPLPMHLTERALQQFKNDKDASFTKFADLFHHRLLSLFYRAWSESRPTYYSDDDANDSFSRWVNSLLGVGVEACREKDALPDNAKRYFAARFADQHRSAEGLHAVLMQYFDLPVQLEQFVGQHLAIPRQFQLRLGDQAEQALLGVSATLGVRVWECQNKFRLTLGPLKLTDYLDMLPGGRYLTQLIAIVRNYIGDELDWDVHLILSHQAMKPAKLGAQCQLGWTSWLYKDQFTEPQQGLVIDPKREALT